MGPIIHPRTTQVNNARHEISAAVSRAIKDGELTYAELFFLLADIQHSYACDSLREERTERRIGE